MLLVTLILASLLALVPIAVAHRRSTSTTTASGPTATSIVPLNLAAKAAGKLYFGSATDNPELTDIAYVAILNDTAIFGQLTPANSMKWDAIEPEQNIFNFTGGNQIVALAEETGKIMRGHNLVSYHQLPHWYRTIEEECEASHSFHDNRLSDTTGSYAWDVINEPLNDNGTMRADVFYSTLNTSYINVALQTAREADPYAKLYMNEYNLEYTGPKIDAMVQLVEDLLEAGVPIDGIGFECHFILGEVSPSELRINMERITALGLEVAVTELDDRIQLPATEADLYQQQGRLHGRGPDLHGRPRMRRCHSLGLDRQVFLGSIRILRIR
ncbi:glycoside hydrolase family 10 protein [Chiua virens]|nr:glycoside hydrolase family 10 protein [Chiua virens]